MTQCEECGGDYPQSLEDCPHCAVVRLAEEAKRDVMLLRGSVIVAEILIVAFVLLAGQIAFASQHGAGTKRVTATAVASTAASDPYLKSDRWVPVDGEVLLTLTLPKSEMGGGAQAWIRARGLARNVLDCVPAATSVAVFDGNASLIGRYQR